MTLMIRTLALLIAFSASISASAILTAFVEPIPETCGNNNGRIHAYAFGGSAPYTYAWTGPNGYAATTDSIFGLAAGTYQFTVTDALFATAMLTAVVDGLTELPPGFGGTYAGAFELTGYVGFACVGACNGAMAMVDGDFGGTAPFMYNFSGGANYLGTTSMGHPVYSGFCLEEVVSYSYTDALGCQGLGWFMVQGVGPGWFPVIDNITGSCTGAAGGSVQFTGGGEAFGSDHTLWSGGQLVDATSGGAGIVSVFADLAPGAYELRTTWIQYECIDVQAFTVPDLGTGCGTLSGSSWYDVDGDCIRDAGEVGIPGSVLAIEPGGYFALTQSDGSFALDLPDGNYTLAQTAPTLVPICPPVLPVAFTMGSSPVNIELANGSTAELDLQAWLSSNAARPGFNHRIYASVRNLTPPQSGPVTATLTHDPAMTFLNANPAPTSETGNVLTWEWPAFGSFEAQTVQVNFNIPVSTTLGTVLSNSWTASNTLPEASTANNTYLLERTVTGSYDPNDKTARTSTRASDELYFINSDEYIDYTIRFQNTGTDTAFTVVITDTLSTEFDMSSFEQGVCSHPCTVDFKAGRVVEWTFNDILLPDSNVNEVASHGLTSFRIRLNEPVFPGTIIENIANIFFDFNPPVITEPSVLMAEFSTRVEESTTPSLSISPVPVIDHLVIRSELAIRSIILLASEGREVMRRSLRAANPGLDVSFLKPGTYLIVATMNDGSVRRERIVKQ